MSMVFLTNWIIDGIKDDDLSFGSMLLDNLLLSGFKVKDVKAARFDKNNTEYRYQISYDFQRAFSAFAMHMTFKTAGVRIYDIETKEYIITYSWVKGHNEANSLMAIAEEFVQYLKKSSQKS